MKTTEQHSQLVAGRTSPVVRAAVLLLGVTIAVTAPTRRAAAQGAPTTADAGTGRVLDSLAFELLKARASLARSLPATLFVNARLGAMLPADPAQRARVLTSAVTAFDAQYATDSAVFGPVAHTYAVRFSEAELRQLIAYERMRPEIDRALSASGEGVVTAHRAELQDIVRKAVGTVTGSTPAPMAPGPLVSVTAMPPFLPSNVTDLTKPVSGAPAAAPPPCTDTGKAPATAFRGPPYNNLNVGSAGVVLLGTGLGAPTVQTALPVRYPPALQASGTQGTVTIHYWINPSGCAEPASLQVTQASDSAMAAAVRDAVRRLRFVDRSDSGKKRWASVDQVFTFRITP